MKSKLLPIFLITLIVLNAVLIYMLLTKPHERGTKNKSQRNFLIEQLQLSMSQSEQFKALERPHKEKMRALDAEIKKNKDFLFRSFSNKNVNADSITTTIGSIVAKKEAEVFHFFHKVRNLCNKDQLKSFDDIIMKALHNGKKRGLHERGLQYPKNRNHPPRDRRPPVGQR